MGRGQVVRHQFLVLAFRGSNPFAPAKLKGRFCVSERPFNLARGAGLLERHAKGIQRVRWSEDAHRNLFRARRSAEA